MTRRAKLSVLVTAAIFGPLFCHTIFGQSKPGRPAAGAPDVAIEFPAYLRQDVEAGKTPVGTKIEAKLSLATLFKGVVIPQDATFSGELVESAARSGNEPSRLSIRIDSAQWRNGATPKIVEIRPPVYLSSWYYLSSSLAQMDAPDGFPDAPRRGGQRRGGTAPYPDPNTSDSPSYSKGNTGGSASPTPSDAAAPHRVQIKNVGSIQTSDGRITLTSRKPKIKLNKSTNYVFVMKETAANATSHHP